MYNELIDIGKDGNVFLKDNSIALMPNMWNLYKDKKGGSNQVRWIVCVYDYKSPYRKLPEDERKNRVSYMVFEKNKNPRENDILVKAAIEEYINAAAAGFVMPIVPATIGGLRSGPVSPKPNDSNPNIDVNEDIVTTDTINTENLTEEELKSKQKGWETTKAEEKRRKDRKAGMLTTTNRKFTA